MASLGAQAPTELEVTGGLVSRPYVAVTVALMRHLAVRSSPMVIVLWSSQANCCH